MLPRTGYRDLRVEAFEQIQENEFEQFCRVLLDAERRARHATSAEIYGPAPKSNRDGGVDLRFVVKDPPHLAKETYVAKYGVALTDDAPGQTIFSCKTGKNWRKILLQDAKKKSERVVEALLHGGRLTIIVNVPLDPDIRSTKTKKSLRDEITTSLWDRMRRERSDAEDPTTRIRFVDAHQLRQLLQLRGPIEINENVRQKLGVGGFDDLKSFEDWRHHHRQERDEPEFTPDAEREELLLEIATRLSTRSADPDDCSMWLHGPPGVGKTRLVIEMLMRDEHLRSRTRVALSAEAAEEAVERGRFFEHHPSALLIVDDCPMLKVDHIARESVSQMRKAPEAGGAVLLLTPMSFEQSATDVRITRRFSLHPMDAEAHRRLIAKELGPTPDHTRVHQIARLTEGYPWFAVLVAREVRRDPTSLPENPTKENAADLALASRYEVPQGEWKELVLARARTLLATMLTEDIDWNRLSDPDREGIWRAVGASSWDAIADNTRTGIPACIERGILRMRLGRTFKYVTPAVLAREVALKLLTPPPGGPEGRWRHLREHAHRFVPAFCTLLERLEIDSDPTRDVLSRIATEIVNELAQNPALEALGSGGIPGAMLRYTAHHQPGQLASLLRRIIETATPEALRVRRDIRQDLIFALESIARRRDGFDDAEISLFDLAILDNESLANNAKGAWSTLFLIELNPTYRTFDERLRLLRERCLTGQTEARLVALAGLDAALSVHTMRIGDDQRDGPCITPTYADARRARLEAWSLLIQLATDPDAHISANAHKLITSNLRGAVRGGLAAEVAQCLAPVLCHFAEGELMHLRKELDLVVTYDRAWLDLTPTIATAWTQLFEAAAPRSYIDRLHQAVGTWGPAYSVEGGDALDESLAREGITPPYALLEGLNWLTSGEKVIRATPFLRAAGRIDEHHILLNPLLDRARRGESEDALAAYLQGWKEAGHESEADSLLRRLRAEPNLAYTTMLSVWRLGANAERIGWIVDDLRAGRLSDSGLGALSLASWEKGASDATLRILVDALLDRNSLSPTAVALDLIIHRIKELLNEAPTWKEPLRRALTWLTDGKVGSISLVEHAWEIGAKQLLKMGDLETVLGLATRLVQSDKESIGRTPSWEILRACAATNATATWRATAHLLEEAQDETYSLTLNIRNNGLTGTFPPDEVLAWVGRDQERAVLIALMCNVHSLQLPPLVRGLLVRFGSESAPARQLAGRANSTLTAVSSLAEFTQNQLVFARNWAQDPDSRVQRWAKGIIADLEGRHEYHAAHEEHERRRWGT